jgi:hypothetical protein
MNKNFKTTIDGSKLNATYGTLTGIRVRSIDYITGIATWNAAAGTTLYPEVLGSNLDPAEISESTLAAAIRAEISKLP